MGFNINDIFRNMAPQTTQAAAPQPTPEVNAAQAAQNGVPQSMAGTPAAAGPIKSPLDEFTEAFKNKAPEGNQPNTALFNYDPAKVQEIASKMDFAKSLDPQLVQKALQGDPAAFMQAINSVAQNVYAQNVQLAAKLTEQGVDSRMTTFEESLPGRFKNLQVQENLASNPAYTHEAAMPVVNALRSQFTSQYPQASAAQISDMVQKYLTTLATSVTPQQSADPDRKAVKTEQNFANFFGF